METTFKHNRKPHLGASTDVRLDEPNLHFRPAKSTGAWGPDWEKIGSHSVHHAPAYSRGRVHFHLHADEPPADGSPTRVARFFLATLSLKKTHGFFQHSRSMRHSGVIGKLASRPKHLSCTSSLSLAGSSRAPFVALLLLSVTTRNVW